MLRCAARFQNMLTRRSSTSSSLHSSILDQMQRMLEREDAIHEKLAHRPDVELPVEETIQMSIELSKLEPVLDCIKDYKRRAREIADIDEMISSENEKEDSTDIHEMIDMLQEERRSNVSEMTTLEKKLTNMLLPKDDADDSSAILELRATSGGTEAAMFTGEMLSMYQKFAATMGWKTEILSSSLNEMGGCREAMISVKGEGVFGRLKFESGVHRVQRVPMNDTRLHTSAMTVAVLPEMKKIESTLNPSDLRIDVYRSSGAGGQHVNTTESAVRITHIPTGLVAAIQDQRSQHQNKAKAMVVLAARVYDAERQAAMRSRASLRTSQIGTGDRSERIRTYNYAQDRVTDHRVSKTVHGIDRMMQGNLLLGIVEILQLADQNEKLKELDQN